MEDEDSMLDEPGKDWDEIIPVSSRSKAEEEEKQREQLELYLPPRVRKQVQRVSTSVNYSCLVWSDDVYVTHSIKMRRKTPNRDTAENTCGNDFFFKFQDFCKILIICF